MGGAHFCFIVPQSLLPKSFSGAEEEDTFWGTAAAAAAVTAAAADATAVAAMGGGGDGGNDCDVVLVAFNWRKKRKASESERIYWECLRASASASAGTCVLSIS